MFMIEVIFDVIVERIESREKRGTGVRWLLYIINEKRGGGGVLLGNV